MVRRAETEVWTYRNMGPALETSDSKPTQLDLAHIFTSTSSSPFSLHLRIKSFGVSGEVFA
jgi:hypothetical protein